MCKNPSLRSQTQRNSAPFPAWRGAADTPQAVPGGGSSLAVPPLMEKQKQPWRCKQAINKACWDFAPQTRRIYISCSDSRLLYALSFVFSPETRWSIYGTFEFKHPLTVLSDWSALGSGHALWQTPQRFARWAAQRDPFTYRWNAALLHFSCLTAQETFHHDLGQEMKRTSVNPPVELPTFQVGLPTSPVELPASPVELPASPHTTAQPETVACSQPTSMASNATQHDLQLGHITSRLKMTRSWTQPCT